MKPPLCLCVWLATAVNLLALAGELKEPGIAFAQGYPEAARRQVMAALNRADCKFLKGRFLNSHTSLLYASETKALNRFLDDLAQCPGVTLHVSFVADPMPGEPCDWMVSHDAHANSFHVRVNLKSDRIKLPDLYLPAVKGPAAKTVAALTRGELVGEWGGPCIGFQLAADGAGAWLVKGPEGPLPKPEPFKWELSGPTLLLREATAERKLTVTRGEDESLELQFPEGGSAGVWKVPTKPGAAGPAPRPPVSEASTGTDASPAALAAAAKRGETSATADLKAGRVRILHYGRPWSQGKPLVDDATGRRVEVLAGCAVTAQFVAEVDAYNRTVREWHARQGVRDPGKQ